MPGWCLNRGYDMPYITQMDRARIKESGNMKTAGELNYAVTKLINHYVEINGGVNYTNLNTVIGALECAKMELYRRVAAPYEDTKININGDVYTI